MSTTDEVEAMGETALGEELRNAHRRLSAEDLAELDSIAG